MNSLIKKIIFKNNIKKILDLEEKYSRLSDDDVLKKSLDLKKNVDRVSEDDLIIDSFSLVRESTYRLLGIKHYPVQLLAGMYLYYNNIIEMKTGEGKTIVALLPAYLQYLKGKKVFIVTSNEYLAKRDKQEMELIFNMLGASVGLICSGQNKVEKDINYNKDIIYGTGTEFTFDYLRDCSTIDVKNVRQKRREVVIIDEVDSVLIDRGKQPLILSSKVKVDVPFIREIDRTVKKLRKDIDFEINKNKESVLLTDVGSRYIEKDLKIENIYLEENIEILHYVKQSMYANFLLSKDKDYIVKDDKVFLIGKNTGRISYGVRLGGGLHQSLEAKENVRVQAEDKKIAMTTYMKYMGLFENISGMTGTAKSVEEEFRYMYGLNVIEIPTNKKLMRNDKVDRVFIDKQSKMKAIIEDIVEKNKKGQPVLAVTNYIYETEYISEELSKIGIKHRVLNAKQTEEEANIIKQSGEKDSVTISTNMAGRGTDIKLNEDAKKLGGLYVIGISRNKSRRLDDQLVGRAGRQGEPGETQFFISLEDELFNTMYGDVEDKIYKIIKRYKNINGEFIVNRKILKIISDMQTKYQLNEFKKLKSGRHYREVENLQFEIYQNNRQGILYASSLDDILGINEKTILKLSEIDSRIDNEVLEKVEFGYSLPDELENIKIDILRYYNRKWTEFLDLNSQLRSELRFYRMGKKGKFSINTHITVYREKSFELFNRLLYDINYYSYNRVLDAFSVNKNTI